MQLYYEIIQPILFYGALTISGITIYRGKSLFSMFKALCPYIVYQLINFSVEAILYGNELYNQLGKLPVDVITAMNTNLSICDIKIVLSILALILWFFVYNKNKKNKR